MISSNTQRNHMLTTPIPKLVTSLAIPTVIIQLITLIYNTADTYFISHIDKSASAAVGAVFAIMALIQAIGFGFGMGSSSICSRKLGEKKDTEADIYCSSAFFGAVATGVILAIIGILFLNPILKLIGCSATMLPYARPYARCILFAAPIFCATFVLNNTLRAEGQTRLAMIGMASGGILNVFLDPLFIFYFHMGTFGAALATVLSQITSFLILLSQFLAKRTILHIHWKNVSRKFSCYGLIVTTGFPTICRQGLSCIASAVLSRQAVAYGDAAVAAVIIANKCYTLVRCIVLGIGQGYQPVAGYNYGAGDFGRTRKSFLFATKIGTVVCVAGTVFIALFAHQIMWWFCKDTDVLRFGVPTLYFCCAVMPLMAFSTYVNQLYQCLGFRAPATLLASCRQGIFFLPAILLLPILCGITGVQVAQPVADLLTFVISCPFCFRMFRKYLHIGNPAKFPTK